jgi:tetratricopeptide (TPR) repeat protein
MADTLPSNLSQQEIERLVQDSAAVLRRGDLNAAYAIAEKALAAGAEHPFLLKLAALWLHANGQYRDALRTFHHARQLTPDDPTILNGIAGCLGGMGAYEEALKIIDASFELKPDAATTHHLRGWIQEAAHDLPAAKESYERTLSLSRDHVPALAGLASVAVQMGDFPMARERAAQVLARDPRQPTAIITLATVEIRQGEAAAAEVRLRELLSAASLPAKPRAMALGALGDALDAQDRGSDALAARQERDEILRAAARDSEPEPS